MAISCMNRCLKKSRYEARETAVILIRQLENQVDDNPEESEAHKEAMSLLNDHDELTQIVYDLVSSEISKNGDFIWWKELYEQCHTAVLRLGF